MSRSRRSSEEHAAPTSREPYVGRAIRRVEDRPLLTGEAAFVDDVELPGQAWARIVRSNVAHGSIGGVDADDVRRRPDVIAVITAEDLPDVRVPIRMFPTEEAERVLQPPLARETVRYVGEPIAIVVATDPYAAEDAAAEVVVDVEPLEVLVDAAEALADAAPIIHPDLGANLINTVAIRTGPDVDGLLEGAHVVVRESLRTQRNTAVPMETRGLAADYDAKSGRVTVWGAAKTKHFNLTALAAMLDVPVERIRLVEVYVGGGFGARGEFYPEDYLIPWLALSLRRPVKWIEDRTENFVACNHAREQICELEIGADADGRLIAMRARCLIDQGAYARTHGGLLLNIVAVEHLPGPYMWQAFEVSSSGVLTNKTPVGTYRGPSQYEVAFFRERTLDVLAGRLGIEPAELRRRNLIPVERLPHTFELEDNPHPIVYDAGDFPLTWERMLEAAGFDGLCASIEARRSRGELVGVGLAAYVEAGGAGPIENARVEPREDGRFVVHVGVASLGQGVSTGLGQIAADSLGVAFDRIEISHHDTDVIPEGMGAFASRTTVLGGSAIVGAVGDLHAKAIEAAAERLEIAEADLEVAGDTVRPRGAPGRGVTLADLGCEGEFRFEKPHPSFGMGASLALVSIDRATGDSRVERYVVCHDIGAIVNPLIVDGQMVGAAAQGIAGALLEELPYDRQGQPLCTSFMDYSMPTAVEVPPIAAVALELDHHDPATSNPLGLKGAGEAGIVSAGAAVANAVADALGPDGIRIESIPLTPQMVLAALDA